MLVSDRRRPEPLMLVPLAVCRRHGLARLEFIDFGLADYNAPLIDRTFALALAEGGFPALWRRILAAVGPVDTIHLSNLPESIGGVPNPFLQLPCRPSAMSYHTVLDGGFEGFLKARSTRLMADTRTKRRRLERQGQVAFQVIGDAGEVDRAIDALIEQKSRRYQFIGAVDIFLNPDFRDFYRNIAKCEVSSGFVHLSVLTLDDRIVAVHLGIVFQDRMYMLMPAFDLDRFAAVSPGRLLLLEMVRWCCDHGVRVFDFTTGNEQYKSDWTDRTMAIHVFDQGVSARGRVLIRGQAVYRRFKARYPGLVQKLKAIRVKLLNRGW
ncbi:MAG TPA: GNAT family N-acetyltransferase [Azospirillaceae bacterium]|nr:GNAT family N-acetyltransferase [Azospirillaceae bacterium]